MSCAHPTTRMVDLQIRSACATATYACVSCGVQQSSESWNLARLSAAEIERVIQRLQAALF